MPRFVSTIAMLLLAVLTAHPAHSAPTEAQESRLQEAFDLTHSGQIPEAMETAYALLQEAPDYVEAHRLYIDLLGLQGRAEDAIHFYRLALDANPGSAAAHYLYGRSTNDPRIAETEFREALALDPGFAWAHHGLGAAMAMQGDLEGAIAKFEEAIALQPDMAEAHNHLANLYLAQEREDDAIASYRRAIEMAPDSADAYFYLGTYFAHHERLDEAADLLEDAVRLDDNNPMIYLELGCVYFDLHREREAVAAFDEGLRIDAREEYTKDLRSAASEVMGGTLPREAFDPFRRGLESVAMDPQSALAAFDEALGLAPEFSLAHLNRGIVLASMDRTVEAEDAVRQAILFNARNPDGHSTLAVLLMSDQRFSEAEASLQQALALDPAHSESLRAMGMVYMLQERAELAVSYFKRASALSPRDLALAVELAGAHVQADDLAAAEETLRAVLRADPRFNFARHQLAALLAEQERWDESIAELEELKGRVAAKQDVQTLIEQLQSRRRLAERGDSPKIHLAQILVKDRSLADELRAQAEGGADFGQLARSYSVGPTAAQGGDIGEVILVDLNPLMATALEGVPAGGVSQVVETPAGFLLFKRLN